MANELEPHAARQQLGDLYRAMSDEELLDLAARPGDLTDAAQDALRNEMGSRRLEAEEELSAETGVPMFPGRVVGLRGAPAPGLAKGKIALMIFHDAIAAGEACDCLEADGIEIEVRDVATPEAASGSFYGGPPVALQVIVPQSDQRRAMAILREKMGLFPAQEVEVADEPIDDGTTATLGNFGRRDDAEDVARVLAEAGIWHRIEANPDGDVEHDDAYTLQVREIDLMRAGDVVEKAMDLPEG
jgi:hypothetical protein